MITYLHLLCFSVQISIRPPPSAGSTLYNYQLNCSVALMALADSHYRLLYVCCNGRVDSQPSRPSATAGVLTRWLPLPGWLMRHSLLNSTLSSHTQTEALLQSSEFLIITCQEQDKQLRMPLAYQPFTGGSLSPPLTCLKLQWTSWRFAAVLCTTL